LLIKTQYTHASSQRNELSTHECRPIGHTYQDTSQPCCAPYFKSGRTRHTRCRCQVNIHTVLYVKRNITRMKSVNSQQVGTRHNKSTASLQTCNISLIRTQTVIDCKYLQRATTNTRNKAEGRCHRTVIY
jgi:hypothetical protein